MIVHTCGDCGFVAVEKMEAGRSGPAAAAAREHYADTWHHVATHAMRYYDGAASCPTCITWPCRHVLPKPTAVESTIGRPTRFPGTPLKSGLRLCELHAADYRAWSNLDPGSDEAKRLVRPSINLVQIGSPRVQLQHGESYMQAFRRIVGAQIEVVTSICGSRRTCADVEPIDDVDPRQHCLSEVCFAGWRDHMITYCSELQWVRCNCPQCGPLYTTEGGA